MSVLIVEDNPVSAKMLEICLQKAGYTTIVTYTGSQALERLQTTPEIQLVISDIMMPEMDGLELLQRMKDSLEWRDVPLIISTALGDAKTVWKAAAMGCRHFVVKPIKVPDLLDKVRQALDSSKQVLRDKAQMILKLGLDHQSYNETLQAFATQVREKTARLEQQTEGEGDLDFPTSLTSLSEGAALLGAERLVSVLEGLGLRDKPQSSDYAVLLKELKILQGFLPASE